MNKIEFFIAPDGETILGSDESGNVITIDENSEVLQKILSIVKRDHPKAYEALEEIYKNSAHYKYLMARRFIKCNFSVLDNKVDMLNGEFNIEHVSCPMRGECKWERVICLPEFSTVLTDRETEIILCIANGMTDSAIADKLFISIFTVDNHRKNIYKKLDLHNRAELILYAQKIQKV